MKRKSYEEAIIELEGIVKKLERGELSLEESLEAFQSGIELTKYCNTKLDEMEKKITILLENEKGEIKEEDFSVE
ncbi:exodeoxyribonuclease VII small subunit [Pseudobacteroides cellulosolvens]|uniref:Exodeoxyribonuclease 7 small subunit n=1 Tax=Pseudobacteroides cellulosolvens ATCC 35603 = DSM 2933 TaxID=398512 RepID=A0A0L6JN20_9FIRM|nr:exodeoxyribonuclease VII small subunit [Pseudobacteroides cellulosolvens]KNY26767.1 Exodeoxyribonuclease 7 small subunit [Pseudobacteroides cellulosolvens ATCC 35603 = DSM 2933]